MYKKKQHINLKAFHLEMYLPMIRISVIQHHNCYIKWFQI